MENSRFKFRVFDKKENELIERGLIDIHLGVFSTSNLLDSTRFIIEQCTGLKDKNGNLLYENDIVYDKFDDCYKLIYWDDEGCWSLKWEDVCGEPLKYGADFELYGNIHEDPELLDDNKIQAKELDDNKTSSKEEE